jgi:hypothetical protein
MATSLLIKVLGFIGPVSPNHGCHDHRCRNLECVSSVDDGTPIKLNIYPISLSYDILTSIFLGITEAILSRILDTRL